MPRTRIYGDIELYGASDLACLSNPVVLAVFYSFPTGTLFFFGLDEAMAAFFNKVNFFGTVKVVDCPFLGVTATVLFVYCCYYDNLCLLFWRSFAL